MTDARHRFHRNLPYHVVRRNMYNSDLYIIASFESPTDALRWAGDYRTSNGFYAGGFRDEAIVVDVDGELILTWENIYA